MQGHMISLPYTPQVLHCRYVGDITSDVSICKLFLKESYQGVALLLAFKTLSGH